YRVQPELAREFSRQFRGTFLACSRQLVGAIERHGFALSDRVEVLPNWVTGPRPLPRRAFREGGVLRIVAAAAMIDRNVDKGIDLLIRAAGLLRKEGREGFALDVYGRVNDGSFAELIRALDLSDRVTLKGMVEQDDLLDAYGRYDLFAFPGR